MIRRLVKKMLSFIAWLLLLPILIIYKIQSWFTKSERFFSDLAQLISIIPGTLGNYIRREFYKFSLKGCSEDCCISFGTIFAHPDAEIGKGVYIGLHCMIGTVTIGDNVLIGSNVDIIDGRKQHSFDSREVPIKYQKRYIESIKVGRDSWLGNSAVVMANVGEGCVIGAGSVVVKDIEDFSIAVGNPAGVIKKRK